MSKTDAIVLVLAAAACLVQVEGKHLGRCELVSELRSQGFPADKLRDWVCLVEAESSGLTHKKSKQNRNGSYDYGLFQINDKYWCSAGEQKGKDCNVRCADLLTDDITAASTCAKKVFRRHGFNAWYGWRNKCQGALPDISSC